MCICPNCGTGIDVEYKRVEAVRVAIEGLPACGVISDLEEMINGAAKEGWRVHMPLSKHAMLMVRTLPQEFTGGILGGRDEKE